MARWGITTSSDLKKKQWHEKFYRDTLINNFFTAMEGKSGLTHDKPKDYMCPDGKDASNVITINRELGSDGGDAIQFSIIEKLDPEQVISEGQTINKNLQSQTTYSFTSTLEWKAMGVEVETRMSEQRSGYEVSEVAHQQLLDAACERRELDYIDAITASPTLYVYRAGATGNLTKTTSAATALLGIETANSMPTPNFFRQLNVAAKNGFNRSYYPLRGVKIPGHPRPVYVFICHDDVVATMLMDAAWQQEKREAEARGKDNPLFAMASLIVGDILIIGHEKMPIGTNGGAGTDVPYGHGVLMGAQAICRAEGKRPKIVNVTEDHETIEQWSYQYVQKTEKPVFNSVTYGSFSVYLAREQISDIS